MKEGESAGHLDSPSFPHINGEVVVLTEWLEKAKESTSMHLFC